MSNNMPLDLVDEDEIRLSVEEATALGRQALSGCGYSGEGAAIIVDQLIDNALCGYKFAGLPRILAIAGDEKTQRERGEVQVVHETPVSALIDGANNVGYIVAHRCAEVAIEKARSIGMASVGGYNSYYSGRNAYFVEQIVREGLVGFHAASAYPRVVPPGGARPMLGTNPICFGFPSDDGPVVFDIGTASFMWGEVMLHAHLGEPLPEGVGFDEFGRPSTDAAAVLKGGVAPFGGHKGFGLSFVIQALGLLGGAALAHGQVRDYGFLFWAIDPDVMLPGGDFKSQMSQYVRELKQTPLQAGVEEIRIPSERAYREREQRRREGIVIEKKVFESLRSL